MVRARKGCEVVMDAMLFESSDLDRAEDFFSRAYTRLRIGSRTPAGGFARFARNTLGSLAVDALDVDFDMSYALDPLGRICLGVIHEGAVRDHRFGDVEDAFGPGDVVSFAPPELPYSGVVHRARYNVVTFDPALLTQVAAATPCARPGPVRLTGHRPHAPGRAHALHAAIDYLRDHVLPDPAIAGRPLVVSTAQQHLAAVVLATFPNTALTEPGGTDRADAHSLTLRRAVAFIDDHADRPITLADIAEAAHVSIRTLQYAFRRQLNTTPLGYLRHVRLTHAHRDLLRADPRGGSTVTDIAARWGFVYPGRFSALYRTAYGRRPRESLLSRRAA
ncbi:helix-turn-helix transcriptional regulator [Streptomyces sp. NPDC050400]|uniref:helix-turn-helix transcriptional regulator n=1 Tax=Streptomyces sp. NPDC050400 TaxID=3365610 RepID=UPI00379F1783